MLQRNLYPHHEGVSKFLEKVGMVETVFVNNYEQSTVTDITVFFSIRTLFGSKN